MCGILGVASTEGMKNRSARFEFMKIGLDIDAWRGWESTGLALVPEGSKDSPIVYKRAINGRDFIQLHKVEKYLGDIEKYSVALGHNRAATTGRGNIVDHNAHPFQYGHITLVHNGHIRNTHELKGAQSGAQCLVDSAHVAYSMNANGELETLTSVDGGFVFVWWNSENSTLNIARNTERPLHMAFAAKENTFYWASELTQLLHLLQNVNIDEDIGLQYPEPWTWYQYNLKNLREYTKTPFAQRQGRRTMQNPAGPSIGGGVYAPWTEDDAPWMDEDDAVWANLVQEGRVVSAIVSNNGTGSRRKASDTAAGELDEIRQTVANQRLKDVKLSGVPTSRKRLSRAKMMLKKLGIDYNSMRNCEPISWCKYKNQDNLGSVIAKTKKEGYTIEVLQVRVEQYAEYNRCKNLLVDCVNVRNGPNNDVRIIGIVSPRMKEYLERFRNRPTNGPIMKETVEEPNSNSIPCDFEGPDGKKVTLSRFQELAMGGCINCSDYIDPSLHQHIIWVGLPAAPLCPDCGQDKGVLELLGCADQEHRVQVIH